MDVSTSSVISNRYRLEEVLGKGGMGIVYRAFDRLSGQHVALKQVYTAADEVPLPSSGAVEFALALSREFETLASLRHPHIISVLDYGFSPGGSPFFTMELLDQPASISATAAGAPPERQVELLAQLLRALDYLHRRGLLHRDLKPSNVLVSQGVVRVLDFGLSAEIHQARGVVGTLAYIAPEIVTGGQFSPRADLYAVGVIFHELLTGALPYDGSSPLEIATKLSDAGASPYMLNLEHVPPVFQPILAHLLALDPEARYASAAEVIEALAASTGQHIPAETVATRESVLQAARFVGREAELEQLRTALDFARDGQGALWLITGESGVGKSRLLNEIRTRALVTGMIVVGGQAAEHAAPYAMWREALRTLLLEREIDDLDAGVLRAIVPDIESVLLRPIPEPPALEARSAQARLIASAARLVIRAERPLLILLEDLHWADAESLGLLTRFAGGLDNRPILIVGTLTTDVQAGAPAILALPGGKVMTLERLNDESVAALSEAFIGEAGRDYGVLELLRRETEGNVFFIVEVIRSLAEEAGDLAHIGKRTLPERVFAGGIQRILQRRIEHVPAWARALLNVAAVAGRAVDPLLLGDLAAQNGSPPMADWLFVCGEAAVLEVYQNQWRFAHDKLRQAVLDVLSADARRAIHGQVAGAMAARYGDNRAGSLAYHYGEAGDADAELHYSRLAAEQAAAQFAHEEALSYLDRVLALLGDGNPAARFAALLTREGILHIQALREAQAETIAELMRLAERLDDDPARLMALMRHLRRLEVIADYAAVIDHAEAAAMLAERLDDTPHQIELALRCGSAHTWRSERDQAARWLEGGLARARTAGLPRMEAACHAQLGSFYFEGVDYPRAQAHYTQSLELSRAHHYLPAQSDALSGLGILTATQGDDLAGRTYFESALALARQMGDRMRESRAINNLAATLQALGELSEALGLLEEGLRLDTEIENRRGAAIIHVNLGAIKAELGELPGAVQHFVAAAAYFGTQGERSSQVLAIALHASAVLNMGDPARALELAQESAALAHEASIPWRQAGALRVVALAFLALGRLDEALASAREAEGLQPEQETSNEPRGLWAIRAFILALKAETNHHEPTRAEAQTLLERALTLPDGRSALEAGSLNMPAEESLLLCQTLRLTHDARARSAVVAAYRALERRADHIGDSGRVASFWELVPAHRSIRTLYLIMPAATGESRPSHGDGGL